MILYLSARKIYKINNLCCFSFFNFANNNEKYKVHIYSNDYVITNQNYLILVLFKIEKNYALGTPPIKLETECRITL